MVENNQNQFKNYFDYTVTPREAKRLLRIIVKSQLRNWVESESKSDCTLAVNASFLVTTYYLLFIRSTVYSSLTGAKFKMATNQEHKEHTSSNLQTKKETLVKVAKNPNPIAMKLKPAVQIKMWSPLWKLTQRFEGKCLDPNQVKKCRGLFFNLKI